jgi:hypothetical protein
MTKPHGTIEIQPFEVIVPDASGNHIERRITIKIPMEWDAEIEEWLMTEPGMALFYNTKLLARLRRINGQVTIKEGIATLEDGSTLTL